MIELLRRSLFFHPGFDSGIVPDMSWTDEDVRIAERLLKAYHLNKDVSVNPGDAWTHIKDVYQQGFIHILEMDSPVALAHYLCSMSRRDATTGITQGDLEYQKLLVDPLYRRYKSFYIKGVLVALAEAVGAVSCENTGQGSPSSVLRLGTNLVFHWGSNIELSVDELVMKIEKELGVCISPPDIDGGLFKLVGSSGLFHERDLNSVYTAWLMKNILHVKGSVLEVGAGSGRVAYWCHRLGLGPYTIVDLPHVNVLQGYYLLKAYPGAKVRLYGESGSRQVFNVLPSCCMNDFGSDEFDLVLNQDSFPEIHRDIVVNYLRRIQEVSGLFLSINQEGCGGVGGFRQTCVPDVVDVVGGYRRLWRMPYWLRRGYVMELYRTRGV